MDGLTFAYLGLTFCLTTERDDDHGAPWEEEDGHGPVRELCRAGYSQNGHYKNHGKRPGEWIFSSDDRHATIYAYDAQAAMIEARRDGWGLSPENLQALRDKIANRAALAAAYREQSSMPQGVRPSAHIRAAELAPQFMREPTKGDIAAEAVRLDFEHLRGWVSDEWEYSSLKVELCDVDGDTIDGEAEYLGGVVFEYGDEESLIKEYGEDMAHELASRLDLVTRYKPGRDVKANRRKFITQGAARIRVRN